MRILIITQYFWPETFQINDLALGLRRRGHDVMVLTGLPNYPGGKIYPGYDFSSREDDYEGIEVKRVPLWPPRRLPRLEAAGQLCVIRIDGQPFGTNPLRESGRRDSGLRAVADYRRPAGAGDEMSAPGPDLVLGAGPVAGNAGSHQGRSVAVGLAASRQIRAPRLSALRSRARAIRRVYDVYRSRRACRATGSIIFPNCSESIFRPLDLREQARDESAELPSGFRILFAGNIGVSQSFDTILDAAELTRHEPTIQWIVLGDGRERSRIEQEIHRRHLGATVHLPGPRPIETMPLYYAAADALLVSLKREPIFALTIPSKVQSYLACGKPILAFCSTAKERANHCRIGRPESSFASQKTGPRHGPRRVRSLFPQRRPPRSDGRAGTRILRAALRPRPAPGPSRILDG